MKESEHFLHDQKDRATTTAVGPTIVRKRITEKLATHLLLLERRKQKHNRFS